MSANTQAHMTAQTPCECMVSRGRGRGGASPDEQTGRGAVPVLNGLQRTLVPQAQRQRRVRDLEAFLQLHHWGWKDLRRPGHASAPPVSSLELPTASMLCHANTVCSTMCIHRVLLTVQNLASQDDPWAGPQNSSVTVALYQVFWELKQGTLEH